MWWSAGPDRIRYDATLRVVMWLDCFWSLVAALVFLPLLVVLALVDVPAGASTGLGVVVLVGAVFLAATGAVTAVLLMLRMRAGEPAMPAGLRLPLPRGMHPDVDDPEPARRQAPHQPFASLAVAMLTDVRAGDDLVAYLEGIDQTLAPYGGRFVVHGGDPDAVEGTVAHDLVVIGFPAADGARRWYDSPAYRRLAPLRHGFASGSVVLYRGERDDHRAVDVLAGLRT